jgi:hypothetical protein
MKYSWFLFCSQVYRAKERFDLEIASRGAEAPKETATNPTSAESTQQAPHTSGRKASARPPSS